MNDNKIKIIHDVLDCMKDGNRVSETDIKNKINLASKDIFHYLLHNNFIYKDPRPLVGIHYRLTSYGIIISNQDGGFTDYFNKKNNNENLLKELHSTTINTNYSIIKTNKNVLLTNKTVLILSILTLIVLTIQTFFAYLEYSANKTNKFKSVEIEEKYNITKPIIDSITTK